MYTIVLHNRDYGQNQNVTLYNIIMGITVVICNKNQTPLADFDLQNKFNRHKRIIDI